MEEGEGYISHSEYLDELATIQNDLVVWERASTEKYVVGFDDYKKEECLNRYHKIRKFLGLKYKVKETKSFAATFKRNENGTIEYIKGF